MFIQGTEQGGALKSVSLKTTLKKHYFGIGPPKYFDPGGPEFCPTPLKNDILLQVSAMYR